MAAEGMADHSSGCADIDLRLCGAAAVLVPGPGAAGVVFHRGPGSGGARHALRVARMAAAELRHRQSDATRYGPARGAGETQLRASVLPAAAGAGGGIPLRASRCALEPPVVVIEPDLFRRPGVRRPAARRRRRAG